MTNVKYDPKYETLLIPKNRRCLMVIIVKIRKDDKKHKIPNFRNSYKMNSKWCEVRL